MSLAQKCSKNKNNYDLKLLVTNHHWFWDVWNVSRSIRAINIPETSLFKNTGSQQLMTHTKMVLMQAIFLLSVQTFKHLILGKS